MNIIKHKKIYFGASGFLVALGIMAVLILGFRQGVDLAGGTDWQLRITSSEAVTADSLKSIFQNDLQLPNVLVFPQTDHESFIIRFGSISEEEHRNYLDVLREKFESVEELRFESIGPSIGRELRRRSLLAAAIVLLGISLYVAWAFRKVSYPVNSWKYGLITLVTLFHDVTIPAGFFAVLGWWQGVEIDTNFIVALLVIMGFSVHDTIVVFDRIRENLTVYRSFNKDLSEVINLSVNETLARSLNTSLTLIFVLLALIFWGPQSLFYFILTILIGTVVGTYSSIFVASPLLTFFRRGV